MLAPNTADSEWLGARGQYTKTPAGIKRIKTMQWEEAHGRPSIIIGRLVDGDLEDE